MSERAFVCFEVALVAVIDFDIPFALFVFEEEEWKYVVVADEGVAHEAKPQIVDL